MKPLSMLESELGKAVPQEGLYAYGVLYQSPRFRKWEESKSQDYARYRLEWNLRVAKRNPGKIPLNLNVEVTTRCNLACTFCSHPSLTKAQTGDLSIALYKKVLAECDDYGGISAINLNGLGEPTLRKDLNEFVSIGKAHGAEDIMFHTNGTQLVSENAIEKLINAGIDRIIVSVDSPDKDTYESMRLIKGSWNSQSNSYRESRKGSPHELLIKNVRSLINVASRSNSSAPVIRVTCVLTDKTLPQMESFKTFWINEGADVITYQDLTWHDKLEKDGAEVNTWSTSELSAIEIEYEGLRDLPVEMKRNFVCPPLYQSAWIEFDGQVVPCSHPDARSHMVMGKVQDSSIDEIWQGENYKNLRELHESGKWSEHPICGRCEVPLIEMRKRITGKPVVPMNIVEQF
jgi:radical SAM protein with 4Fe4S-binding SPASM domain